MYSRAADSMAIEDVLPLAKSFFPGQDEGALTELAEVAIVNAPEIKKGEETGFEFVHKSFSEYLVAELVARTIDRITHRIDDFESKETWQLGAQEATQSIAEMLAVRVIPREVQEMLEPMMGSFIAFYRGQKVEDTVSSELRLAGLGRVRERFEELYSGVLSGKALRIVTELTGLAPLLSSPLEAYANYSLGVVLVGAAAARRIRSESSKVVDLADFCLEPFEGALWRWLMLVHAGSVHIDDEIASRLYKGIDLGTREGHNKREVRTGDWSLPIKLGLLQAIPGYKPNLREAIEEQQKTVREVTSVISTACLAISRRDRSHRGTEESSSPSRGRGQTEELDHFIEHVFRRIEASEDKLAEALKRGGFMFLPSRERQPLEDQRSRSDILNEIRDMSQDDLERFYRALIRVYCGGSDKDAIERLKTLVSRLPGRSRRKSRS
jgi:hypothetical protein